MKSTKVGPQGKAQWKNPLPDANPEVALQEIERRNTVAKTARAAASEAAEAEKELQKLAEKERLKAKFIRERSGWVVVNYANEQFSTRCDDPNFRVLSVHPAASDAPHHLAAAEAEAKAWVATLMADSRMNSVPAIIQANVPTPIPYSEETALKPSHYNPKRNRNLERHVEMVQLRNAEFNRRVKEAGAIDRSKALEEALEGRQTAYPNALENSIGLGSSEYHRRKTYLKRKQEEATGAGSGAGAGAPAGSGSTSVDAGPRALPAFGTGAVPLAASADESINTTLREVMASASSSLDKVLSHRAEFGLPKEDGEEEESKVEPAAAEALADDTGVVQPLFALESVPAHWRAKSGPKPASADNLPKDLQVPDQNFVVISFLDDLDRPEHTPKYPKAAGVEPLIIIYGAAFGTVDDAKAFITNELGRWCTDLPLDVVDTGRWLFPTAVDPDKLTEEHRVAGNPGLTQELNTIMTARKNTQAQTAEARANAAAAGVPLMEVVIDPEAETDVPDIDSIGREGKPDAQTLAEKGMFLQGAVEQLDKAGNLIGGGAEPEPEPDVDAVEASGMDDLPDLEDIQSDSGAAHAHATTGPEEEELPSL